MKKWFAVVVLLALGIYVVAPILLKTGVIDGNQVIPLPIALSIIVIYCGVFVFALIKADRKVI